jgi:hypothetical protein
MKHYWHEAAYIPVLLVFVLAGQVDRVGDGLDPGGDLRTEPGGL